jgi:hypothetical protein
MRHHRIFHRSVFGKKGDETIEITVGFETAEGVDEGFGMGGLGGAPDGLSQGQTGGGGDGSG